MTSDKHVLILGFAKSGYSAARYLLNQGYKITVSTKSDNENKELISELEGEGVSFVFGEHPLSLLDENFVFIVKNPGIPYTIPFLMEASRRGTKIYTEVEFATNHPHDIIGITGSNGKTTTTTLIHQLLNTIHRHTYVCGNIGRPVTDVLRSVPNHAKLVIELSSFQLLGIERFNPDVAVLLNLTPSHLDYHGNFEEYKNAKARLVKNQTSKDYVVYNFEDSDVSEIALSSAAIKIPFSNQRFLEEGASIKEDTLYYDGKPLIQRRDVALPGKHNLENILAAICVAKIHNVPDSNIVSILKSFFGVEHRLQFVSDVFGRRYYNDSKATNIQATKNAVSSFDSKPILIAGGLDRGNSFDELVPVMEKCKFVFLVGQSAPRIQETADKHNLSHVMLATSLELAALTAHTLSSVDDVILLSPACASWDQYRSFEERGEHFISIVQNIEKKLKS